MMEYVLGLLMLWAVFAVAATVVGLLAEEAGFVHVGAAAFLGLGAYTVALLSTEAGVGPQLSLMATIPIGGAAGLAFHLAVQRLTGDGLALATLAISVIVHGVMVNATPITGGPMGIAGIPVRPSLLGHETLDIVALLAGMILAVSLARTTVFGMRVRSIRDDENLADDLELRPGNVRAVLWVASSAVLALVGGAYAQHVRYIDPSSFSAKESVAVLAMALLLPTSRAYAGGLGAMVFVALPELLRFMGLSATTGAEVRQLLFGLILLFVVARGTGPLRPVSRSLPNA